MVAISLRGEKNLVFFFLETRNKLANSSKCVKGGKEIHRSIKTVEVLVLSGRITPIFISFRTAAARDLWWGRLTELVREESMKEPPDTNIQVVYHDNDTNTEYVSAAYSSPSLRGIYRRYTHDDVQSKRREREMQTAVTPSRSILRTHPLLGLESSVRSVHLPAGIPLPLFVSFLYPPFFLSLTSTRRSGSVYW